MRLLVVSQWFPYPPINGARQRVYHLLRGLSERHDIHLLSFTQLAGDAEHAGRLAEICREVALVPGRTFRPTFANWLRAFFSMRPRSSISCWSEEMALLVREQLRRHSFDAAIAFTTATAEYLAGCGVPSILDDDNVDTAYFHRMVQLTDNPLTKFRRKLTWVKLSTHERRLVATFDATAAVSEEDRQELARIAPEAERRGALYVVPNGVDLELMNYQAPEVDRRQLVSTGALTYQANLDAAIFFCEEILPRIRAEVSDARLVITGGHKGVDVAPLTSLGATLTGFLEDVRPTVAGSAALVVPLRIGGGTRLKILEAMALGTPVVSTSLGAAGLGLKHEETALIADRPEDFAGCVLRIMQNDDLRVRLISNARRHVAANFGWDRSVAALEQIIESVAGKGRGK